MAGVNHARWQLAQQGCGPFTDLTGEPLGDHSYTTTLTTNLGSTTAYTISVDQDTWIRSDQPTDNKATDGQLHVRYQTGIIERPMYRYDVSPIPVGSSILSATAWFYVSAAHPEGQRRGDELIAPDGVMLAGGGADPALDLADGQLGRPCGRLAPGRHMHRVVLQPPRLGKADQIQQLVGRPVASVPPPGR